MLKLLYLDFIPHVLATAIEAQTDLIVTSNLKDFPSYALEPYQIKAISPDDFLVNLVNLFGSLKLLEILQQQANDLDFELNIILAKLRQNGANNFVSILHRH